MKYRIHFTTGESIVLDRQVYLIDFVTFVNDQEVDYYINPRHITHITPEPEGTESTIIKTPNPSTVKEEAEKKRQEIIGNPKAVLSDIQNEE